jgi:hypothetical protein
MIRYVHIERQGSLMVSILPAEVTAFIAEASQLPAETLDEIRQAVAAATASGVRDVAAPKLSASDFSALDKRVRDMFADRAMELRARPGGLRAAIAQTTVAAQAIWKPGTLTPAQYRALVGPFAEAGIETPGHVGTRAAIQPPNG